MIKFLFTYFTYFLFIMFFLLTFYLLMNISNHPVTIMIMLLIYSSIMCLNMSMWKSNYILSIFLFLMMISGLLIIFLYFSSLISNVQFKIKINLFLISLILFNIIISYMLLMNLMNSSMMNLFIYKYKFHEIQPFHFINKMNFNNIINLYEYPLSNLTMLSMFYLLMSLFSIIKICSLKSITLRKIN